MLEQLPKLTDDPTAFPAAETALTDPNGLLAYGGDLSPERLIAAYRRGIFPWYAEGDPILWWCPDPRTVIFPQAFHTSRSLHRLIKQQRFVCTINRAFERVIFECAAARPDRRETWITAEMRAAYIELHVRNHAMSIECWESDKLVGGLYGVKAGAVFSGESMFSAVPNASKVVMHELMHHLTAQQYKALDCQMPSAHLASLGAVELARSNFLELLR